MGKLIVISGASGVGKGTVMKAMMEKRKDLGNHPAPQTRRGRRKGLLFRHPAGL